MPSSSVLRHCEMDITEVWTKWTKLTIWGVHLRLWDFNLFWENNQEVDWWWKWLLTAALNPSMHNVSHQKCGIVLHCFPNKVHQILKEVGVGSELHDSGNRISNKTSNNPQDKVTFDSRVCEEHNTGGRAQKQASQIKTWAEAWPAVLLHDLAADQWLKRKPVLRGILSILGYTFLSGGSLRKQILVHHNTKEETEKKLAPCVWLCLLVIC